MPDARSTHLRRADIRKLYRLVGDVRVLRETPTLQRQRMVDGLCELIGAWHGFSVHFTSFTPHQWVQATSMVPGGTPDTRTLQWFAEWGAYNRLNDDPLVDATTRMRRPVNAIRRRDLEAADMHHGSGAYRAWYEVSSIGDSLVCLHQRNSPTDVAGLALHREQNDPDFTIRDRRLVRLFMAEMLRLYRQGELAPQQNEPILSPRQQQVLQAILHGRTARQIAQQLGISRRTVEEHMQALYHAFGVANRSQLMASYANTPNNHNGHKHPM